jgi:hypothetical protein
MEKIEMANEYTVLFTADCADYADEIAFREAVREAIDEVFENGATTEYDNTLRGSWCMKVDISTDEDWEDFADHEAWGNLNLRVIEEVGA